MQNDRLFIRQATGLVRSWSVFDAFIYAFFSVNLVTLGFYIFSFAPYVPEGHLIPAVLISAFFVLFMIVVYASLISVMPRSGGDYVWQSRILSPGIGFVLAFTGWVVILWHWVPLYGTMLVWNVFAPILVTLSSITGSQSYIDAAIWLNTANGSLFSSMFVIGLAFLYVGVGMRWYSRIQKTCFFIAIAGLVGLLGLLLTSTRTEFMNSFNAHTQGLFGTETADAYQQIIAASAQAGYDPVAWSSMAIIPSLALIPMVLFFNLWPNWGATLYGEVRGAGEFRRNFAGMASALIASSVLAVVFFALVSRTFGWEFYHAANFTFYAGTSPLPIFPYPGLLAGFLTDSPLLQLLLLLAMSAWFFGWCGTVFLSSTRVIFATSFDRLLPEWISKVSVRTRSPINALIVMTVPSIIISVIYAYSMTFVEMALATTLVISATYVGSTIAAVILPYRMPELYNSSPVAKYRLFGVPLITVCGVIFLGFMAAVFYAWFTNPTYGLASTTSYLYMGTLYLISLTVFLVSRWYRKKQGIDMNKVYGSIPAE